MNNLFVVGLTGPTGAGKSAVAQVWAQNGCDIIDADALSRQAVSPNSDCLKQLTEAFSSEILWPDGSLNRAKLAQIAFADPEATATLNRIVHPHVIAMTHERLKQAEQANKQIVVIDAPLLFQAGMGAICQCTVAVVAPDDLRLQRICRRDGISPEQAKARMAVQPHDTYYIERACVVIHNEGELLRLQECAQQLFEQWEKRCNEQ